MTIRVPSLRSALLARPEDPAAIADRLFRRALLMTPARASPQDLIDLVGLGRLAGYDALARLLLASTGLDRGFGAEARRWWRDVGHSTGFWVVSAEPPVVVNPGFAADVAVCELRMLMALPPDPTLDEPVREEAADEPSAAALASWCDRLSDALDDLLDDAEMRIGPFLHLLMPEAGTWPLFDPAGHADKPTETLARMTLFNCVKCFVLQALPFATAPLGSGELLEAVAHLPSNGLGAFLTNTRSVVRDARDVLVWSSLTAPRDMPQDHLTRWRLLLAAELPEQGWRDFVSLLAQTKEERALTLTLDHLMLERRSDAVGAVRSLRDACLHAGLAPIALAAQRCAAELEPRNFTEALILADIAGLMQRREETAAALAKCLVLNPRSSEALTRERLLAKKGLEPYLRAHGFFGDPQEGPARLTSFGNNASAARQA